MKRVLLPFFICLLLLSGCAGKQTAQEQRFIVVASIYPMAEFARAVGGDLISVDLLVPAGTEAHDWQPAASDLKKIRSAGLFVYNGGGMEPWAEKVIDSLGADSPRSLAAGQGLFAGAEHSDEAAPHEHSDEAALHEHSDEAAPHEHSDEAAPHEHSDEAAPHEHSHEVYGDVHVWLDPLLAVKQTEAIRDALIAADSKNSAAYKTNAAQYIARLEQLHAGYEALSAKTQGREFIVMHAAFGCMAKRYGWNQVALMGQDPHAEPSPAVLVSVGKFVQEEYIRYLFSEPQISDKTMQEIARQTGARVLTLDPLESAPASGGYITAMENNLRQLALALAGEG